MDSLSRKEVLALFKGSRIQKHTIFSYSTYHIYVCPMCDSKNVKHYISSTIFFYHNLTQVRQKIYGINTLFCSKDCLIKFIQKHAGDILVYELNKIS